MEDEEQHLPLEGGVDILGGYVVLEADLGQVLAEDVGVVLEVLLGRAQHLHPLQHHYVGILLEQGPNHSPVPEVFVEICQPPLLQQHLVDCLLAPEEEDVLAGRAEIGELQVVGGHFRQAREVLFEIFD